jgi:hypothetical protein
MNMARASINIFEAVFRPPRSINRRDSGVFGGEQRYQTPSCDSDQAGIEFFQRLWSRPQAVFRQSVQGDVFRQVMDLGHGW